LYLVYDAEQMNNKQRAAIEATLNGKLAGVFFR